MKITTCPKCGERVAENRCTVCGYVIPEEAETSSEKKVFLTMPNLKETSMVVNRQYAVGEFSDQGEKQKKTMADYLNIIGKYALQGILMIGGIALLGTILTMGSDVLEFLFSWTHYF